MGKPLISSPSFASGCLRFAAALNHRLSTFFLESSALHGYGKKRPRWLATQSGAGHRFRCDAGRAGRPARSGPDCCGRRRCVGCMAAFRPVALECAKHLRRRRFARLCIGRAARLAKSPRGHRMALPCLLDAAPRLLGLARHGSTHSGSARRRAFGNGRGFVRVWSRRACALRVAVAFLRSSERSCDVPGRGVARRVVVAGRVARRFGSRCGSARTLDPRPSRSGRGRGARRVECDAARALRLERCLDFPRPVTRTRTGRGRGRCCAAQCSCLGPRPALVAVTPLHRGGAVTRVFVALCCAGTAGVFVGFCFGHDSALAPSERATAQSRSKSSLVGGDGIARGSRIARSVERITPRERLVQPRHGA